MSNNTKRRNVLVIMCDQLRPDFLGAYGADFIPTPNIDALAADGCVFDNAITASTITSRAYAEGVAQAVAVFKTIVATPEPLNDMEE